MRPRRLSYAALAAALVLIGALFSAAAQTGSRLSVAVLGLGNTGGDPRQDYLASLAEGILRYDLSVLADIPLVERRNLDKLLSEREFSLSAAAEPGQAIRAGGLLGATHLVLGEYAVVAGELSLTVHLVDTASGAAVTFRDRGTSEHVVHRIAEKLAARLLDRRGVVFADAANDRSILSLRDETPGVIALHSPIRSAEVYLDDEFVGFTKGNELEPILLESVRPGRHTLRVHLPGGDFGVVVLPQVEFKDWEAVVDVRPGGRHAIRDQTRHFNEFLYRLENLDFLRAQVGQGRGVRSCLLPLPFLHGSCGPRGGGHPLRRPFRVLSGRRAGPGNQGRHRGEARKDSLPGPDRGSLEPKAGRRPGCPGGGAIGRLGGLGAGYLGQANGRLSGASPGKKVATRRTCP